MDLTCALGPDNVGPLLLDWIAAAKSSLDISVFELGPSYVWPLCRAAQAGVEVRVLLDGSVAENFASAQELIRGGCQAVLLHERNSYLHWKFLVVDGEQAALGTGNLIQTDAPYEPAGPDQGFAGTREWWVYLGSAPGVASVLQRKFAATFAAARPPIGVAEEAASPRADIGRPPDQQPALTVTVDEKDVTLATSGAEVALNLEGISKTEERLWLTQPYVFTGGSRVRTLLHKMQNSAAKQKRVLLGETPHEADVHALRALGVDVRVMHAATNTRGHAKGAVLDDCTIVSSANWSEPGLSSNQETSLTIRNPEVTAYFADCFERDWNLAQA